MSKRNKKSQKKAIKDFIQELTELEKKYKVYIDGWFLTEDYRGFVNTPNSWDFE